MQIRGGRHDREVGGGQVGRVAHDEDTVRGAAEQHPEVLTRHARVPVHCSDDLHVRA
ncbi:hypothetical protein [Streptomyces sp. NPDC050600]|uniref:hypothetical protein n=1 Tax=Streptomyces sp. NPDC050600 TaxID=3157213 RepID=UPI0034229D8E